MITKVFNPITYLEDLINNNYDAKIKFPEGAVKIDFSILRLGKDNSKNFK